MTPFTIVHKETGLTLQEYAKQHPLGFFHQDGGKGEISLPGQPVFGLIDQSGRAGFYFNATLHSHLADIDFLFTHWLPNDEWEVRPENTQP